MDSFVRKIFFHTSHRFTIPTLDGTNRVNRTLVLVVFNWCNCLIIYAVVRENLKFGESEDVSDSREQSVHAHAGPDVSRSMVKMMKSVFSRSSHHHSTTTSSSVSGSLQVEDGAVSDLRQIRMKRETLASVK